MAQKKAALSVQLPRGRDWCVFWEEEEMNERRGRVIQNQRRRERKRVSEKEHLESSHDFGRVAAAQPTSMGKPPRMDIFRKIKPLCQSTRKISSNDNGL